MNVIPVAPGSILTEWGNIEPLLFRVIDRVDSGHTPEDILTQLQTGQLQLWKIGDWQAMAVTQVVNLPQMLTLSVYMAAGADADRWMSTLCDTLVDWARQLGCKYLEFYGRPGWQRKAAHLGFNQTYTVMRREIDHGRQKRRR